MNQKKQTPGALAGATEGKYESVQLPKKNSASAPTRQQKWRRENPKRYAAHLAVQTALRLGILEKKSCEVCGKTKVDAHHRDYDRPYAVTWLCRAHHVALHRSEAGCE
ncbi:hypothetical protein DL1_11470 [Thioclava dalianensis]|uniref:Uncharacterized protein n=1 Tax=Thioclava dalianensis TaxID=1185766 RepID=A0A074TEC9_9RHOB|nr:hypothetical protein [Thioclava dalianensis]KEP68535.1 hypothetical protein DL1_11470 [Thioclava dalianensis]SFN83652.1 hypothetical protein SAMN05216224_1173 [Thioclava dalianensis]